MNTLPFKFYTVLPLNLHKYLNGTELTVFIAIYNNWSFMKNEDGWYFRSQPMLAEDCNLSLSSVQRGLKKLIKKGIISINVNNDGVNKCAHGKANEYKVNMDKLIEISEKGANTHPLKGVKLNTFQMKEGCQIEYLSDDKKDVKNTPFEDNSLINNELCENKEGCQIEYLSDDKKDVKNTPFEDNSLINNELCENKEGCQIEYLSDERRVSNLPQEGCQIEYPINTKEKNKNKLTNITTSTTSVTLGTGVEKMKTVSNEGVDLVSSSRNFSFSESSLSANENIPSTGGEENKSSNMEVRNASGDAGEALDSSVDNHTTSTHIVQTETPETQKQQCPDKSSVERILKGRTFQQFFNDFVTWAEGEGGENATSDEIIKIEKKLNTLKECGFGTDKQWKKCAVKISILKQKNRGKNVGGAPENNIKPYVNKIRELKRFVSNCPYMDMMKSYFTKYNGLVDDLKKMDLTDKQCNWINKELDSFADAYNHKLEELLPYASKPKQPSRKVCVNGEKSHDKLYQLMDEMDRGGLYKQDGKLDVVKNLINSYAEIYKGEHNSMSGFSRSFSQTANEWWGVLDPFRSYPLIRDVMGEMALHESFN